VKNKHNSPVNIRFVAKTSDIRNFSENIRSGNTKCNSIGCCLLLLTCLSQQHLAASSATKV